MAARSRPPGKHHTDPSFPGKGFVLFLRFSRAFYNLLDMIPNDIRQYSFSLLVQTEVILSSVFYPGSL